VSVFDIPDGWENEGGTTMPDEVDPQRQLDHDSAQDVPEFGQGEDEARAFRAKLLAEAIHVLCVATSDDGTMFFDGPEGFIIVSRGSHMEFWMAVANELVERQQKEGEDGTSAGEPAPVDETEADPG
jgi:hypothetical protein